LIPTPSPRIVTAPGPPNEFRLFRLGLLGKKFVDFLEQFAWIAVLHAIGTWWRKMTRTNAVWYYPVVGNLLE
jgi:hypothetical protein